MTANLPPQLLRLFVPRPPLPFLPPTDKTFEERKKLTISGIASFLDRCKDFDVDYIPTESPTELKKKRVFSI